MSLFGRWTVEGVIEDQQKLCSDASATNNAVTACTTLDQATSAAWTTWYSNLQSEMCSKTPVWLFETSSNQVLATGEFLDLLDQFKREHYAWQQKLASKCALAPVVNPFPPELLSKDNPVVDGATLASTIKYVTVGVAVLSAVYLGAKVVDLVPSAKLRARTARERERTARVAIRR